MSIVNGLYLKTQQNGATFPYDITVVLVGMETFTSADPWESTVNMNGQSVDESRYVFLHIGKWVFEFVDYIQ